ELIANVAEWRRFVAAGRSTLVQHIRASLDGRKHAVRLAVRADRAAHRDERQCGGESCEPSFHVSNAAMRAAISSPSCRSFASAYSAISRAYNSGISAAVARSEEHTSELQSRENLVCRL